MGARPEAVLAVRVQPRASRTEVAGFVGDRVRLRVTAPPANGAANDAVRRLLARALGCPPSAVEILRGQGGREKRVRIVGLEPAEVRARLARAARDAAPGPVPVTGGP